MLPSSSASGGGGGGGGDEGGGGRLFASVNRKRLAPVGSNAELDATTTTPDGNSPRRAPAATFGSIAKRARTSSPPSSPDFQQQHAVRLAEERLSGPHRGGLSLVEDETSRLSTLTERSGGGISDDATAGDDDEESREESGGEDGDADDSTLRRRLDREVEALTAAVEGWGGGREGRAGEDAAGTRSCRGGEWCLSGLRSWRERVASEVASSTSPSSSPFPPAVAGAETEARPEARGIEPSAPAATVADGARGGDGGRSSRAGRGRRALRDRRKEARREVMRALRCGGGDGGGEGGCFK